MGFACGDDCDGWASYQRYLMSFSRASGDGYEISAQYATWESKAGDSYRFIIDRDRGDGSEHVEGRAVMPLPLGSGDGKAVFTTPGHEEFLLPAETLMPTEHTLRLIQRSEEHTSELQSLMRISYAVFCLKKNTNRLLIIHHVTIFSTIL